MADTKSGSEIICTVVAAAATIGCIALWLYCPYILHVQPQHHNYEQTARALCWIAFIAWVLS